MITITPIDKKHSRLEADSRDELQQFISAADIRCSAPDSSVMERVRISRDDLSRARSVAEKMNAQAARSAAPAQNADAPRRIAVEADRYSIGDTINGWVITGFGRSWFTGGDNSHLGLDPSADYVQYAYFDGGR